MPRTNRPRQPKAERSVQRDVSAETDRIRERLRRGMVIPAHPLALTRTRRLDERRQRALTRYYLDAGAGGLAIGVHTTQFAIREAGLLAPVLELGAEAAKEWRPRSAPVLIAGICGATRQALAEARLAADLGYDAGLVSLAALPRATDSALIAHLRAVSDVIPVMGFYLQPAVGGRALDYGFWRAFATLERVVGVKIAPFDRAATLDVLRAVADSGRAREIPCYTGNDDHIILDLLTTHRFGRRTIRMVGGLLGQWAMGTHRAVLIHRACRALARRRSVPARWLTLAAQLTDLNAAIFDRANDFRGCIPGIHEVLRRQGLLNATRCLEPAEVLSPGQAQAIERVMQAYPHLTDRAWMRSRLDRWLR
jgi:dihydrodipicolinate synthase/N-acetylneuraminate lyase